MRCFFFIIAYLFAVAEGCCGAEGWAVVKKDETGSYEIDKTSVVKIDKSRYRFWVKISRNDNFVYNGPVIDNYKVGFELDCNQSSYRHFDMLTIDKNGFVIDREKSFEANYESIIPESMPYYYKKYICNK